jgi:branched-chain amino acid transport system substrate-binding protein
MGVAQRHNKVLVHHTLAFPTSPNTTRSFRRGRRSGSCDGFPNTLFDALAATPKPPKTIAIVTSKFPSVHFMYRSARRLKAGLAGGDLPGMEFGNATSARSPRGSRTGIRISCLSAPLGGGQPAARRYEEDRLRAEITFLHVPGAGANGRRPRRRMLAATIFEQDPPYTNNPGAAES